MSGIGALDEKPRRFYKSVAVNSVDSEWGVSLDGRSLRTPEKAEFLLPTRTLAEAVAAEWETQSDTIDIANMFLTRLCNVAIDRTPLVRQDMVEETVRFAETDLVCFLDDQNSKLKECQEAAFAPLRDWASSKLDVFLVPAHGVMATRQPPASLDALRHLVAEYDDFRLTGLVYGAGLFSSVILSLALMQSELDGDKAFAASRIDESFQAEQWGEDEDAAAVAVRRHLEALALEIFFRSLEAG